MNILEILQRYNACFDAIKWVKAQTGTPQQIWESCKRGDWLLWIAARIGVGRKLVVTAACLCAREVLPRVTAGEDRPLIAIETAERWTRGEADIAEVRAAAAAAALAADNAASAAANAAYAAHYAAAAAYADEAADDDDAYDDATAAEASAYAAADAADAAADDAAADDALYGPEAAYDSDAAAVAARAASLASSADLVRSVIPWSVVEAAIGGAQ